MGGERASPGLPEPRPGLPNSALNRYEVTITGESYFFTSYATNVTPMGIGNNVSCVTDSVSGKLLIACTNSATGAVVFPFVGFSTSKP